MTIRENPVTCVWEITMGCNMRCQHCGSSCTHPLSDELLPEEALDVADQIGRLGLKWVTLSGGEPLTRKDWPEIVARLVRNGVTVNMISNGWLITDETVRKMRESGISTVAISVDGTRDVHDRIRKEGSFDRLEEAFKRMKAAGIDCGAVTTVTRENLDILDQLKEKLISMGVASWQLQIGLPMGNLQQHPDWLISPEQVDTILDFCDAASREGRIKIIPADCLGYFTRREMDIRIRTFGPGAGGTTWEGCNAGLRSFGLLQNGDILGCTSIRNREFVEGNLREKSLREIWENPENFSWRRKMVKEQLDGECRTCKFGAKCLGGCPNTRLTMRGTIYGENDYCSYNVALKKSRNALENASDADRLFREVRLDLRDQKHQLAAQKLDRIVALNPENLEAWRMKGFVDFMTGNFDRSELANRRVLEVEPGDNYARKGLGLALWRQGKHHEGLEIIEDVVKGSNYRDFDAMHDLIALYLESGRHDQAGRLQNMMSNGRTM